GRQEVQRPDDLKRRPDEDRRKIHEGRPDETGVRDVGRFALGRNGAVSSRHGALSKGRRGRTARQKCFERSIPPAGLPASCPARPPASRPSVTSLGGGQSRRHISNSTSKPP